MKVEDFSFIHGVIEQVMRQNDSLCAQRDDMARLTRPVQVEVGVVPLRRGERDAEATTGGEDHRHLHALEAADLAGVELAE